MGSSFDGGFARQWTLSPRQCKAVVRDYVYVFVEDTLWSRANVAKARVGGVSQYARNANEDVREMAMTVADDWKDKGIDALLTERLVDFAKGHGVKRLYSTELAENAVMRQLDREIDMSSRRDPDDARQVIYSLSL